MSDTKERILQTSLGLFAQDGYEAVSVSRIAAALSMTKGALYKHYQSKRDIFDRILERMEALDAENAGAYAMPGEVWARMPEAYRQTAVVDLLRYSEAQFLRWTTDAFSVAFRRMLTLEQYRSPEMRALYQQYLAGGPVDYLTDLFREMMAQGIWKQAEPAQLATDFYAPLFLLMSLTDGAMTQAAALTLLQTHMERFCSSWLREA